MSKSLEVSKNSMLSYDSFTPAQCRAMDRMYEGNCLFIGPKGVGKCSMAQHVAQELIADGEVRRVLVLAPLKVCDLTWRLEHTKWADLQPPALALGDAKTRRDVLCSEGHKLVVMNLENVAWAVKNGYLDTFDGLIVDESTKLKAPGSATVKALRKLKQFKWRLLMTASGWMESGIDLYAQVLLTDGGQALGRNFDRFKRTYFFPTDFQERNWDFMPGGRERLADDLKEVLYIMKDDDYETSLPELRDTVVHVEMPADGWRAYREMAEGMYIDDLGVEAVNAAVMQGKLTQIASGGVYDDDRGVRWIHHAKFTALRRVLADAEGPVLLQYEYIYQLEELRLMFPDLAVLGDAPAICEARWNAGELSLLACHAKSASHGLNLQSGGHELVVLTPIWSADNTDQLVGRLRRRGQRSGYVRRTTLVVPGTVDELIMDRVLGKQIDEKDFKRHLMSVLQK